METSRIELTPEQQGVLAALSRETGEPVSALIDQALEALQERLRVRRENGTQEGDRKEKAPQPMWEEIIEASSSIPDEAFKDLPTDLAANVDHYVYGLPKRTS